MYYVIDKPALQKNVTEEISMVADKAYTEDGVSLYDSIMVTSRDKDTLDRFIEDAVSQFVRREYDVAKFSPDVHFHQDEDGNPTEQVAYVVPRLEFYVPDFDMSTEPFFKSELTRYIVLFVCANVLQQRRATLVQEYATRAEAAMDKAVSILKTRKQ